MWCILFSFGLQLLPCCTMHAFFVHVGTYMLFASYSSSCWPCFSMLVSWALDPGLFVFCMALHVVLHWWGFRSVWLISVRRHAFSVIVPWNGLWCLYSWRGWLSLYGGIGRKLLPSHVIASMNPYILRHLSHFHMHYHGCHDFTLHVRLLCIALATLALCLAWHPLCRYWSAFLMARAFSALCCVAHRSLSVHVCFLGFLLLF